MPVDGAIKLPITTRSSTKQDQDLEHLLSALLELCVSFTTAMLKEQLGWGTANTGSACGCKLLNSRE